MEFDVLLRKRHNVYGFLDRDVPDEVVNRILRNSLHVPSGGFTQDFDLVVVKDRSKIERIADAAEREEYNKVEGMIRNFITTAPLIVVPCANKNRFAEKYGNPDLPENARLPWWLIDSGFASFVLILSAFQEGLAASFIGALEDGKIVEILGLPRDNSVIPLAIIPIGYEHPKARDYETNIRRKSVDKRRRKFEEMVHWEKW